MSDSLTLIEEMLGREARLFAASNVESDDRSHRTYIVADFEYQYHRSAHAGYQVAEGAAAEEKIRWPFHRIVAAAWTVLRFVPGQAVPEIEAPVVLTAETMDEKTMVTQFFDALAAMPQAIFATWGGEAKDLAALRRAAVEHDLCLPVQLLDLSPYSIRRLDLCNASSVMAASVHLPEYAAALAIPSKPSPRKEIGQLVENRQWDLVADQVAADVLTTCVIAIGHLKSMAVVTCDRPATIMALAEKAAETFPKSIFCSRSFRPWARDRLRAAGLRGTVFRAP
ncbi:hypothetical protein [Blastomonas sp.]|uniref:hypothetical protein n=1 Tax=Blastomonas sp. TaxID=1909299 RepID=UPI00359357E4